MSGAFDPFRYRAFAIIWGANFISLLGTWMNDVGAGWLMATLDPSPVWVAMVQTASKLPVLLFALPAGALADLVDRRWLIIAGQATMALGAGVFALLVHLELVTPFSLLLFTFFLGTGLAFYAPARNAVVPALVPRRCLHAAIVLNSVGINLARAIGPALAGFLIVWAGMVTPFALNAISFTAVVAAYLWWRTPPRPASGAPREPMLGAIVTGLRFARASVAMRAVLIRAAAFFVFASAFWAVLPLIAKEILAGGSELYGILLGCIGAGAVGGALLLSRLAPMGGTNAVVNGAGVVLALALALFALVPVSLVAVCSSLAFGAAWVLSLSLLNASAQMALPDWVRARGMSILLSVFFGSLALGSVFWGLVAEVTGIRAALMISAAGSLVALFLVSGFRLAEQSADEIARSDLPAGAADRL